MSSKKKLVLHVDINNTVMVADSKKGRGTLAGLHKIGRKLASANSSTTVDDLIRHLAWPRDTPEDSNLVDRLSEGSETAIYNVFPSFFRMLYWLKETGREYAIVFRSFGADFHVVLRALSSFSQGKHPLFPSGPHDLATFELSEENLYSIQRTPSQSLELVTVTASASAAAPIKGHGNIFDYLSQSAQIIGICDDYDHWQDRSFIPEGGKPLLLCEHADATVQHIFFDDHISSDDDSIVGLFVREAGSDIFRYSDDFAKYQAHLVTVSTAEAICDLEYFVKKVIDCELLFASKHAS